jgi:hypothetical protein
MKIAKKRYFKQVPDFWKVLTGEIKDDGFYTIEDINYFKGKLAATTDPILRSRIQNQIDQLEDALIIYRITRGRR